MSLWIIGIWRGIWRVGMDRVWGGTPSPVDAYCNLSLRHYNNDNYYQSGGDFIALAC